jgi:hypothetical protein
MGADFVFSFCDWPINSDGSELLGDETTVALVQQRLIEKLNAENLTWDSATLEEWGVYIDTAEEFAEWLKEINEQIADLFGGGWVREVSDIYIGGKRGIITGGMSWGDDPTDYYRTLAIINDLNITKERF